MAIPWGQLAALAAQIGSKFIGSGGEGPQSGYDIIPQKQDPWDFGTRQKVNQFQMDSLGSIMAGQQPEWLQNYLDPLRSGMMQNLQDTVYGSAGRPGTLRDVMGMASITGVGPKAAMTKGSQHIADYMTEGRKIDEYIGGLGANFMGQQAGQLPGQMYGQSPLRQDRIMPVGGIGGTAPQQFDLSGLNKMPWGNMFGGGNTQETDMSGYQFPGDYESIMQGGGGGQYEPMSLPQDNNPWGSIYGRIG